MSAKLELGNIYRTHMYGDDMWKKRVCIPLKMINYKGDNFYMNHLSQHGKIPLVVCVAFFRGEKHRHLNHELSYEHLPLGQEMVTKVRNPNAVWVELFDQIFDGTIKGIGEDKFGEV